MRILIAEDDPTSRLVLASIHKKDGYEVTEAVDGAAARAILEEPGAPSLVILDWMMPKMDGLDVVRLVRARPAECPPYIIMLTTKGEKVDIIEGLEAGANDYMTKPFDLGELRARVTVGRRMVEMQEQLLENGKILAYQATHDALTGMLNRRAILERLGEELARVKRYGGPLAVGMLDIDHFKSVNDTYGHKTGDDVLCGIKRILGENLREYDSVGRVGGEEFLLIVPMKSEREHLSIFERLCETIAGSRIPTDSGELAVTVSIGVACPDGESTVDKALETADAALYQAKREGRNRVVCDRRCPA